MLQIKNRMGLKNQILLVNACILAGLVFEYFRGAPMLSIVTAAIFLLLLVNVIFNVRLQRTKKMQ
jgi:uncharacterized membrane protein